MKIKDILFSIALVLLGGAFMYMYMQRPKIAYLDLPKVYDGFDLKKELETKYKNTSSARKLILDSLQLRLQQLSLKANGIKNHESGEFKAMAGEFSLLKREFDMKQGNFSENDQVLMNQYEKEIWNRINQYAKDFSKEKGIDLMLGADGSGNVMNVNQKYELTDDFIKYINEHYQGNQK